MTEAKKTATLSDLQKMRSAFRKFEDRVNELGYTLTIDRDELDLDVAKDGRHMFTLAYDLPETVI